MSYARVTINVIPWYNNYKDIIIQMYKNSYSMSARGILIIKV